MLIIDFLPSIKNVQPSPKKQVNSSVSSKIDSKSHSKVDFSSECIKNYNLGAGIVSRKIPFTGKPLSLDVPNHEIGAEEAIRIYENLYNGEYLNIFDDKDHPEYKDIRLKNYSFLDRVSDKNEKERFIRYYQELTGFPDIKTVSQKLEDVFKTSLTKAEYILNTNEKTDKYSVIWSGYNQTCSVGHGKALPGSDIDAAFIVIKGDGSYNEQELIHEFSKELWFGTDQRILSYNHPDAFPQIYTLKQVEDIFNTINSRAPEHLISQECKSQQEKIKGNYCKSYIDANPYFLAVSSRFTKNSWEKYKKSDIKNFGFFAECLRDGKIVYDKGNDYDNLRQRYINSEFFKMCNLSQIKGIQNMRTLKPKISSRDEIPANFNKMNIDEKYDLIKDIIRASSEDNMVYNQYFNKREDLYAPLINQIT